MLSIGFLTSQNRRSRHTFSGVMHSMHSALERRGLSLVDLGSTPAPGFLGKIQQRLGLRAPLDTRAADFEVRARAFAARVKAQLHRKPCDVVFAPVASAELYCLESEVPLLYCSDVTYKLYHATYSPNASGPHPALREQLERRAIGRATRFLYSSRWAASSAVADYAASADAIDIAAFGANVPRVPPAEAVLARCHRTAECRLVFVGHDFHRKGGDIAIAALRELRKRGLNATLTMVGPDVPLQQRDPAVQVFPFLSRERKREAELLHAIYSEGHFFLLPTRADCSPIVLSEAAAYGLPVVCPDVGGISDLITPDVNGSLVEAAASPTRYADAILELWESPERYRRLVLESRRAYDERLNWDAWAARAEVALRKTAGV